MPIAAASEKVPVSAMMSGRFSEGRCFTEAASGVEFIIESAGRMRVRTEPTDQVDQQQEPDCKRKTECLFLLHYANLR